MEARMSRQDHPSLFAHMESNLVTRVISASLEQLSASDSLPRRVVFGMGSFEHHFYTEKVVYNARQPRVRKAWAAIGDRERA
jgi:hypothetical protein